MKLFLFLAPLIFHLTATAQYQVQKGHWVISHNIGGYNFTKTQYKTHVEGQVFDQQTLKKNGFELTFTGPEWGSIGIGSEKSETLGYNSKSNSASIWLEPAIGYFVRDNLMIGANVLLGFESLKYDGNFGASGKAKYMAMGLGPVLRYYIGKNTKHKPFAGFESRFELGKENEKDYQFADLNDYEGKKFAMMIRPYAGYAWFMGKRWTATARIEYTYAKQTVKRSTMFYSNGVPETTEPDEDKQVITTTVAGLNFGISYTF